MGWEWGGYPLPSPLGDWGALSSPPGFGAEIRTKMHFMFFKLHKALKVDR